MQEEARMITTRWRKSSHSGGYENCVGVAALWRKSRRSGPNDDDCVEVADLGATVGVRDSKDPDGPKLALTPGAWSGLRSAIREGQHDLEPASPAQLADVGSLADLRKRSQSGPVAPCLELGGIDHAWVLSRDLFQLRRVGLDRVGLRLGGR
jgi:Domain of unknown function (DUF397)